MAGLTETGFKRRTYDEIVSDKILKAKELFGEDINTEENTPLGKFIRINAYDESELSEDMELMYYSIFPNTAAGVSLDRLCVFIGISRNAALAARYEVELSGTSGATIPIGFLVGTESGIEFYNTQETTFDEHGVATLTVDCSETGEIGNVDPNDIVLIINPDINVTDITSVSLVYRGEETESDYSLRKRFETARSGLGSSNAPSIINSIMSVPSVTSVGIVENDTNATDSSNRPPHSFECYVNGGENYHTQIAEKIFEKKPMGIKTAGNISVSVTDDCGISHTIQFSHTTQINVYVKIKIKISSAFGSSTGPETIENNIRNHISGLDVGGTVIYSSLFGPIYDVIGVSEVTELKLSTNNTNWIQSNITAENYQKCVCADVDVEVIS